MKREEKSLQSKQRILDAALEEFSNFGYQGASLNRVAQRKDISKGLIYHYFKNKDEIYLLCVENCFNDLTEYIKANFEINSKDIEEMLKQYFDVRIEFFAKNPRYLGIFLDLILNIQDHLKDEIAEIKKSFDEFNIYILKSLLSNVNLREDLTKDLVVKDFLMYMNIFNLVFRETLDKNISREEALKEHEKTIHRQIGIILYGILESEE